MSTHCADPAWLCRMYRSMSAGTNSGHADEASALTHGGQTASVAATWTSIARRTADALQCKPAAHTCDDMAQPGCCTLPSADARWPVCQGGASAAAASADVDGMLLLQEMLVTLRCTVGACRWQADRSMHGGAPTVVPPTSGLQPWLAHYCFAFGCSATRPSKQQALCAESGFLKPPTTSAGSEDR